MKPIKAKPGQNWLHWLLMAEGTLIGVCQMIWQTPAEKDSIRGLYSKAMGKPAFEPQSWDQQMRWSAVALLAVSAEQAMKAIALRSSQSGEFLPSHNLKDLWDQLGSTDRKRIVELAQELRIRASGTALGSGPPIQSVNDLEAVISEHEKTFVNARYRETMVGLLPSVGLWNLAMALVAYLRELLDEESAQVSP